jgi:hypothetical protein
MALQSVSLTIRGFKEKLSMKRPSSPLYSSKKLDMS